LKSSVLLNAAEPPEVHRMGSQVQKDGGDEALNLQEFARLRERLRALEEAEREAARVLAMDRALGWGVLQSKTLREILDRAAEAMVEELDAALARIWILDEQENITCYRRVRD
jgi:ribulose 1,5-bisphosphate carboxylase large subunit-like protein